jgi:hypothetical protein
MKKLLTLIAAVALAAIPAVSQAVTLTVTDNGSGSVTIGYTGASENVVGVSVRVDLTVGDATLAAPTDAAGAGGFNAHIDHWSSNPGPVVLPNGNPVGHATAAGLPGPSATSFAISTGKLGVAGATSGDIATLQLTGTTCTTVTLSADTAARGGIVGATGATLTVASYGSVETCPVPPPECLKNTAPEYADWVAFGSPDCWCFRRQCRGDSDGLTIGPFPVQLNDLNALKLAFNKIDAALPAGGICSDYDHTKVGPFRVQLNDLNTFKLYFNKITALVPECSMTNYNFWTN